MTPAHGAGRCDGSSHPIMRVEGTEGVRDAELISHVYADSTGSTDPAFSVALGTRANGASVLLYLTDDEALTLAEQILCSVRASVITRRTSELTQ